MEGGDNLDLSNGIYFEAIQKLFDFYGIGGYELSLP